MHHDEEWLNERVDHPDYHAEPQWEPHQQRCREYHEHMDRWRPMSERPVVAGQYITYDTLDGTMHRRHFHVYLDGRSGWLSGFGTHWKPAGDLPTIGD